MTIDGKLDVVFDIDIWKWLHSLSSNQWQLFLAINFFFYRIFSSNFRPHKFHLFLFARLFLAVLFELFLLKSIFGSNSFRMCILLSFNQKKKKFGSIAINSHAVDILTLHSFKHGYSCVVDCVTGSAKFTKSSPNHNTSNALGFLLLSQNSISNHLVAYAKLFSNSVIISTKHLLIIQMVVWIGLCTRDPCLSSLLKDVRFNHFHIHYLDIFFFFSSYLHLSVANLWRRVDEKKKWQRKKKATN